MNRDIKFRAWHTKEKRFIEISDLHTTIDNATVSGIKETWTHKEYLHSEFELSQYTGLKDKNGKEIYEGDIVKIPAGYSGDHHYKENVGVIKWEDRFFHIDSDNWADDYGWNELEIIGNIYENPKLLKLETQI